MIRRWIIRLPFLLALALVVNVWITSHFGYLVIHMVRDNRFGAVGAVQGLGNMGGTSDEGLGTTPLRFHFVRGTTAEYWGLPPRTLGFYGGRALGDPHMLLLVFPLWLPTVLLAGLNWYVWRKTRSKGAWRGFPVEAVKKVEG